MARPPDRLPEETKRKPASREMVFFFCYALAVGVSAILIHVALREGGAYEAFGHILAQSGAPPWGVALVAIMAVPLGMLALMWVVALLIHRVLGLGPDPLEPDPQARGRSAYTLHKLLWTFGNLAICSVGFWFIGHTNLSAPWVRLVSRLTGLQFSVDNVLWLGVGLGAPVMFIAVGFYSALLHRIFGYELEPEEPVP